MVREEYLRSLKHREAEEVLDLFFYRPVAFVVVRIIAPTGITPNQVTLLSLAAGLVAAREFSTGMTSSLAAGALWYMLANILDCADGQLARLKNSGTPMGRMIDGIADYLSGAAIFIGIGIGCAAEGYPEWWLVAAGAASSILHAVFFDRYQGEYISAVRTSAGAGSSSGGSHPYESLRSAPGAMGILYRFYERTQVRIAMHRNRSGPDPASYAEINRPLIRYWSFLGPTTNRSLLIVCALAGQLSWYLRILCLAGNAFLILMLVLTRLAHRKLNRPQTAGSIRQY